MSSNDFLSLCTIQSIYTPFFCIHPGQRVLPQVASLTDRSSYSFILSHLLISTSVSSQCRRQLLNMYVCSLSQMLFVTQQVSQPSHKSTDFTEISTVTNPDVVHALH
ncbi:unnamed protein product [Heterobilharzia americana]|nr:unnamed protein product [Heterobilharzia americana]